MVLQIKSNWKLEVELHSAALVGAFQSIKHFNINLGAVEGAISVVELPGATKVIKSLFKGSFSLVPLLIVTETDFRTGGKLHLEGKAKDSVNVVQKVKNTGDFRAHLVRTAEQMSVILLEATHTSQAGEGT